MKRRTLLACAAIAVLCASAGCASTTPPGPGAFSFGLFGDMPYFHHEQAQMQDILREMGTHDLAFVVHAGDIKRSTTACTDELYGRIRAIFDDSAHPLVYVPGDNEWTDCHRSGSDPLERLARLRSFFHAGEESLGRRRIRLERQSADARYAAYRENVRWAHMGVLFVGLNVPGSNNNYGRSGSANAEYHARNAANLAWLSQSFEIASRRLHRAVVIVFQANPRFELPRTDRNRRGYIDIVDRIEAETIAFGKPVVLVHGDTHLHRVDKPLLDQRTLEPLPNFTRVETHGSPLLGWVKATFDPTRADLFTFEAFLYQVPAQPDAHR